MFTKAGSRIEPAESHSTLSAGLIMQMPETERKTAVQLAIREMTRQDIAAGLRLCRISRWNQLESDWSSFLELNPAGCRVAEKNGQVAGTVATIRYQDRFGWLAMMLVDPRERRAGIGTQLLYEGLSILSDQRCIRLDATPAGRQLYREHGFVEEYRLHRMTLLRGAVNIPAGSGRARRMREEDLSAVFERDHEVFGADRQNLLRALFDRSPEFAWVVKAAEEGRIQAYCFSRPGYLYRQIGPIVADEEHLASDLLSQCLLEDEGPFVVDVPQGSSSAWFDWLSARGFLEERTFVRMYRGENRYPGIPECLFAVLGPEFG
jgi:GNAT superfamily N-acetyltransferase